MASEPGPDSGRFLPQEVIRRKRDGAVLDEHEISAFIAGVTDDSVTEGQIAALCMAILLKGMTLAERVALTRAMTQSGTVLDWSLKGLDGPVLDKHSTGGVGDKVSLILGPVIAACGGYVPMISGRGLGHTGGTLDKFDSIPGYRTQPDTATLEQVVRQAGCAIIGATDDIAPADRRIYAIRDVTGTVESVDLITASILSKKLAAGLDALVLDVKFGSGAFKPDPGDARALAESLVTVANGAGMATVALLTDMDQVLGRTAGNAVEVAEAVSMLRGDPADARLREVAVALSAELLVLGGLAPGIEAARSRIDGVLDSGAAAERFGRMVAGLGGPADFVEAADRYLPAAPIRRAVDATGAGFVAAIDARALGIAIIGLGGGRAAPGDAIDHAVGLTDVAGLGDAVGPGASPLAVVHASSDAEADRAAAAVRAAMAVADVQPEPSPAVTGRIAGD
ncbi:MAG: thymidine phosphorylase [Inquilinaceae bacterium]